ncbi:MAG: septum formation protein Maf [Planctomycetes bacterium]|nr:septum formation protein Maf [Planctomycetota bacterium]MBL7007524.1 septum formation protein Maf [Planctomycetota bacterium]
MGRLPLVLASTSPRRRALLEAAGIDFELVDPGDDGPSQAVDPAQRVLDHARFKALEGARLRPGRRVLAADTLVWVAGDFLPKPADREQAEAMLRRLSGRNHEVWTGVVLATEGGRLLEAADRAEVRFGPLPEGQLQSYLAGQEWCDKAGAYAIQGAAGRWAELVSGELETVIGLSTGTVLRLLAAADSCSPPSGG